MPWLGGAGLALLLGVVTTALALQPGLNPSFLPAISKVSAFNLIPAGGSPDDLSPRHLAPVGPSISISAKMTLPRPAPQRPAPQRPATPTIAIGSYQQVLINHDRAGARLGGLTWNSCLYSVAVANARRMAAQGYISHTNGPWGDLACRLGAQGGENVGWWSSGVNDVQLNAMFMSSPDHRANIMGPYHYVATAWAVAGNGYAYIAVEFG
jgi:uncharacterized protein YkwD